ncbi:MAG: glycogen phosphorylase, partial [Proteobacteria bacterium]|nr:glycogen phosphorylase [Pseudomonadota bacterium]
MTQRSQPRASTVDETLSNELATQHLEKLACELAKFPEVATVNDHYLALSYVVRDRLLHRWVDSARAHLEGKRRTVIYLSAEYLIGPQLGANLMTLGLEEAARVAIAPLGLTLDELIDD